MAEKNKKLPEYCGACLKRFSYADWSNPVAELRKHQLEDCPKAAKA